MQIQDISQSLVDQIQTLGFDAPYGILTSSGRSARGRAYESITFGRCRTLDAEIQIYGPGFLLLRHSRAHGNSEVYRDLESLRQRLTEL